MARYTMEDVAKEAGVSKSTVSQYLSKRYEYMSSETRQKVKEAIERLGYQPNYIARSLKQKRTSTIGIIVANIMHRFSTEVCRAIEDYCYEQSIHAIICNSDDDPVKEKRNIEMLRARQVDGLVLFPTGQNMEIYRSMIEDGYPVVFVDRKVEGINVHTVLANNMESTRQAISYLIGRGHSRIAIITEPLTISPRIDRIAGYKEAYSDHGMEINDNFILAVKLKDLQQEIEKALQSDKPPTALLAGNDLVFLEVLQFLKERKIKIPKEMAVIVFDNLPFTHFLEPPITTISQPAYEMGRKAAEILLKLVLEEAEEPKEHIFPCQLLMRGSS